MPDSLATAVDGMSTKLSLWKKINANLIYGMFPDSVQIVEPFVCVCVITDKNILRAGILIIYTKYVYADLVN